MGKVKKTTDLADEVKDLLDLLKEGTSYILHIYLSIWSKIVPFDFVETLFDDHKDKSSYDFSKNGKTYIYRLLHSIIQIEKKLVAMGLEYLHTSIPLPFLKSIYENFCVNNNLECTDVKLRKAKKALQGSNKSTSQKTKQGTTQLNNSAEEVATPVPKNLQASIEDQNKTFQNNIQQNQKAFEKGVQDFNKSVQKAFSGLAPAPII